MAVLQLTTEQVIELVKQLPPEGKQAVLLVLRQELNHIFAAIAAQNHSAADPKNENLANQHLEKHNPWLAIAGKYKDDPQFKEVLAYIEEYRKELYDEFKRYEEAEGFN